MDIAILLEAGFRHVIANTTQLHKVSGRIGSKRWAFLDRSHALSKGINVSRAVALSLGTALACAFVTSPRAADLIGQVPLRAPPSVAVPYDWTGAYVGGHVGYAAGSSDWSAGQAGGVGSVGRIDLTKGFDAFKGSGGFLGIDALLPEAEQLLELIDHHQQVGARLEQSGLFHRLDQAEAAAVEGGE